MKTAERKAAQTAPPVDLNARRAKKAVAHYVAALAAHHANPPDPELTEYDKRAIERAAADGYTYPKCPECLGRHGHWPACDVPLSPDYPLPADGKIPMNNPDWNPGDQLRHRVTPEEFHAAHVAAHDGYRRESEQAARAAAAQTKTLKKLYDAGTRPPNPGEIDDLINHLSTAGITWREDEWLRMFQIGGCQVNQLVQALDNLTADRNRAALGEVK